MPNLFARADLDRILNEIDSPRALAILVDDNGEIEVADKNLGQENTMLVCFSLAYELSKEIKARQRQQVPDLPTKPAIYLPPDLRRKLEEL